MNRNLKKAFKGTSLLQAILIIAVIVIIFPIWLTISLALDSK